MSGPGNAPLLLKSETIPLGKKEGNLIKNDLAFEALSWEIRGG